MCLCCNSSVGLTWILLFVWGKFYLMVQNHPQMIKWVLALLPVGFVFGTRTLPPSGKKFNLLQKRWSWTLVVIAYLDFFSSQGIPGRDGIEVSAIQNNHSVYTFKSIINEPVYFWGNTFKCNTITVYITYISLSGVTRIAWEVGKVTTILSFAKTHVFNATSHLSSLCQRRPLLTLTSWLI